MNLIRTITEFLAENYVFVCIVSFAFSAVMLALNLIFNAQRTNNSRFVRAKAALQKEKRTADAPGSFTRFSTALPLVYQFQWQAYVRHGSGTLPSESFRFIPVRAPRLFSVPAGLCAVCAMLASCGAIALSATGTATAVLLPLFALAAYTLFLILSAQAARLHSRRSAQKLQRLLGFVDAYFGRDYAFDPQQEALTKQHRELLEKITYLKESGVPTQTAGKIARLVSDKNLERRRTVAQQKEINLALNGLLQAIANENGGTALTKQEPQPPQDSPAPQTAEQHAEPQPTPPPEPQAPPEESDNEMLEDLRRVFDIQDSPYDDDFTPFTPGDTPIHAES